MLCTAEETDHRPILRYLQSRFETLYYFCLNISSASNLQPHQLRVLHTIRLYDLAAHWSVSAYWTLAPLKLQAFFPPMYSPEGCILLLQFQPIIYTISPKNARGIKKKTSLCPLWHKRGLPDSYFFAFSWL